MRDKTALEVNQLKRKVGTHWVSDNLYLLVRHRKSGGGLRSSWVFRFEKAGADGRRKGVHLGLGSTADFSLAEAKERARKQRQLLADGVDPLEVKRARKAAAKLEAAKAMTFGQCAEKLIETHRLSWKNAKHRQQWNTVFKGSSRSTPATALINDVPIAMVDTTLALRCLEPIWSKTPETGSRVRQRCEAVCSWAQARGLREGPNPFVWRGHLDKLLPAPRKVRAVRHHPSLPHTEIGSFMSELRTRSGVSARALELTILTATRTSEVINATWSEVDLKAKTWTIPGERMKAHRPHKVPLSDRVMELLKALPTEHNNPHLFIGARKSKPLSDMSMLELMREMRPGLTVHGFRSTFRDWAAERTNFAREVAEAALAHVIGDKVEAAYRRGDLFDKRRRMMDAWASFCSSPGSESGNVVSLQGAS